MSIRTQYIQTNHTVGMEENWRRERDTRKEKGGLLRWK